MSHQATARDLHGQHTDERNRVAQLAKHEQAVREREHLRVVNAVAPIETHAYRTPIVHPYDHSAVLGHMLAPGAKDDTGFSDGIV